MERIEMLERAEALVWETVQGVASLGDNRYKELSKLRTDEIAVHTLGKELLQKAAESIEDEQ